MQGLPAHLRVHGSLKNNSRTVPSQFSQRCSWNRIALPTPCECAVRAPDFCLRSRLQFADRLAAPTPDNRSRSAPVHRPNCKDTTLLSGLVHGLVNGWIAGCGDHQRGALKMVGLELRLCPCEAAGCAQFLNFAAGTGAMTCRSAPESSRVSSFCVAMFPAPTTNTLAASSFKKMGKSAAIWPSTPCGTGAVGRSRWTISVRQCSAGKKGFESLR